MNKQQLETIFHALLVACAFVGPVVVHVQSTTTTVAPPPRWPYAGANVRRSDLEALVTDRSVRVYDRSDRPRVLEIEALLAPEECAHIVELARNSNAMQRSWMVKDGAGADYGDARTSSTVFLDYTHDYVIRAVAERVANLTRIPIDHSEQLQVVHYRPGQHYWAHYDYLPQPSVRQTWQSYHDGFTADNRFATALFYLNDVEKGGETVFPRHYPHWDPVRDGYDARICAEDYPALRVRPRLGNAVLFYNMDGWEFDASSLHAGCEPHGDGTEKWAANFWLHTRPFHQVFS